MEDLPAPILVEILSRLGDAADLARCRLASPTLRSLSYDVRAVALCCSRDRLARSRDPFARPLTLPFRSLVPNLLSLLPRLESLSLGVEDSFYDAGDGKRKFDDSDDLHLSAVDFASRWLPAAGPRLSSLTISDLWAQSRWRTSEILALISNCCERLRTLELRNASLSAKGLRPMPSLASLTLEFIRLDDGRLDDLSACFPALETLNLIGVGGLSEPCVRFPRLKTCRWAVSRVAFSVAVHAPDLAELDLSCVSPRVLSLKTPSLRRLRLKMKRAGVVEVDKLSHLRSVRMVVSFGITPLIRALASCEAVEKVEVETPGCDDDVYGPPEPVSMGDLADAFPRLEELELGPGAWRELERSTARGEAGAALEWRRLRRLTVHLPRPLLSWTAPFSSAMALCGPPREVVVLAHGKDADQALERFASLCESSFPGVKWRWGRCQECIHQGASALCAFHACAFHACA